MASQKTGTRYDAEMTVLNWVALAFLLVATVASVTVAVVRGLRLWRVLRSFSGQAETAIDHVMRSAETTEERTATLATNQERLTQARTHLQASLAQLAVLRAAAAEVNAALDRLRKAVPTE